MLNLRSWTYGGISAELRGDMRPEDWQALQPYITAGGYRYRTMGDALRESAEEGLDYSCLGADWSEEEKAELVPSRVSAPALCCTDDSA